MSVRSKWVEDTHQLQIKMGDGKSKMLAHSKNPEVLQAFIQHRRDFLLEEIKEIDEAIALGNPDKVVDAFVDGIVVGIDTLTLMHVDLDESWNRVYAANITKSPGINPTRPNPFGLPDLIKPVDFVAPSHEGNLGLFENAFN